MCKYFETESTIKNLRGYADRKHSNGEVELANGILKAVCYLEQSQSKADLTEAISKQWIQFELEYDEEQKIDMLVNPLPDEEQEVLVTDGKNVWQDTFMRDGRECYFDSGYEIISNITHWMSLPNPPQRVVNEQKEQITFHGQKCRVCGCTWENACLGGCYWVEANLCSQCVAKSSESK